MISGVTGMVRTLLKIEDASAIRVNIELIPPLRVFTDGKGVSYLRTVAGAVNLATGSYQPEEWFRSETYRVRIATLTLE